MTLNIDRSNPDQFYRYKMPRLVAKVEGSGNGIKTVVANITEIAKSLDRPPAYPLKYFGYELGAQTMIDSKNDRYIVNGAHEAPRLQEMLDGFIKKFVLCQSCNNPETVLQVYPKKNTIKQNCAACGYSCMVDMKHKLTTYILKNPPAEVGEYGESKGKGKGKVRGRKSSGKEDEKNGGSKTNGAGDKAAPGSPTTETENPFDAPPPVDAVDGEEFDDDWGEEDTEQARKERDRELTNGIKNLAYVLNRQHLPRCSIGKWCVIAVVVYFVFSIVIAADAFTFPERFEVIEIGFAASYAVAATTEWLTFHNMTGTERQVANGCIALASTLFVYILRVSLMYAVSPSIPFKIINHTSHHISVIITAKVGKNMVGRAGTDEYLTFILRPGKKLPTNIESVSCRLVISQINILKRENYFDEHNVLETVTRDVYFIPFEEVVIEAVVEGVKCGSELIRWKTVIPVPVP
ncbi:uncharacterized protein LOC129583909 [Paramacrobiotus metropolitanus]|uniref:uncharacterized protein LOC129583909 n=1 Tax=Paramacrobiotus metropolitanus TaxID=2943436 RepID=UPI0024457B8E|nr:uncharacterized protein LOC129583909 [Paramacrobiotus metropolitanus]